MSAVKQPNPIEMTLAKTIEWLFDQAVSMDSFEGEALNEVDEKVFQLTFTDIAQTFFVTYYADTHKFSVQTHLMGSPDAHVKTTISDWVIHKTYSEDELAQTFITAMQSIDIDWEEHLSKYIGDTAAFRIGYSVRSTRKSFKVAEDKINNTFKEYLQFEVNLLPTKSQVKHFNQQVEDLAQRLDQLEETIKKLTP